MSPDPGLTADTTALIEAASASRAQVTTTVVDAVKAQVAGFNGWYDHAAITKLATALARITHAGQRRLTTSTDVYGARILSQMIGQRIQPIGPVDVTMARGGVPLDSVYGRLADQYRYLTATRSPEAPSLAEGLAGKPLEPLNPEQVLQRVVRRAEVQADANMTIALREQWAAVTDAAPRTVVGYRRVLHPELATKAGTCGLCVVASDHLYKRGDLMPIHDYCHCEPVPVVGEVNGIGDPGSALNQEDLNRLYEAAGSTNGDALRNTKYELVDHPELGPTLVYRGQRFRSADQVAADTSH